MLCTWNITVLWPKKRGLFQAHMQICIYTYMPTYATCKKCYACVHVRVYTYCNFDIQKSESEWAHILNSGIRIRLFTSCDIQILSLKASIRILIFQVWVWMFTYCDMVQSLSLNAHKFGILVYIHIHVSMCVYIYECQIFLQFLSYTCTITYMHASFTGHVHVCIFGYVQFRHACMCTYIHRDNTCLGTRRSTFSYSFWYQRMYVYM